MGTLSPCACFNVRSAARAVTALYDRTLEPTGLKVHQFAILAVIAAQDGVTMQGLAAELGLDPSTMSRTLRPLETGDLVRTAPGDDRRLKALVLTAAGRRKLADAERLWERAQGRLRELVGEDVFARVVGDLATVTRRVCEEIDSHGD